MEESKGRRSAGAIRNRREGEAEDALKAWPLVINKSCFRIRVFSQAIGETFS